MPFEPAGTVVGVARFVGAGLVSNQGRTDDIIHLFTITTRMTRYAQIWQNRQRENGRKKEREKEINNGFDS